MKDFAEIVSAIIAAGVTLTFVTVVVQNPSGTGQVLTSGAQAFRTTFGTFTGAR